MKRSKLVYLSGFATIGLCLMLVAFLVLALGGGLGGGGQTRLVFASGSAEKEYDGDLLVCDEWQLNSGRLLNGHTASVSLTASRINAGTSANYFTVEILDASGNDVSDNYSIEYQYGQLKVNAVSLYIKSGSDVKIYDATPLTCSSYEVLVGEVVEGETLNVEILGERTDVGESSNTFVATLTDDEGNNVTQNYAIEKEYGQLEVRQKSISIATSTYHGIYDGLGLMFDDWQFINGTGLVDGHTIEVVMAGQQTGVGVGLNTIADVIIRDGEKEITYNYEIGVEEGDLIVTERHITLRSGSASKIYNGEPLTNSNYEVIPIDGLALGDVLTAVVSGSQTQIGSSPNTIEGFVIKNALGEDVTANYEVEVEEGLLVVTDQNGSTGDEIANNGSPPLDDSGAIGAPNVPDEDKSKPTARVFSSVDADLLFRYISFGDFDGTRWLAANEYSKLIDFKYSFNYLTSIGLKNSGLKSESLTIESFANNYILPYYLDLDEYNYNLQTSDVVYAGNTAVSYSTYFFLFDYFSELNVSLPPLLAQAEQDYYEFVRDNYLAIPSSSRALFEGLASQFNQLSPTLIFEVAEYIKAAATYNTEYDRNLDKASDIAVSFLSQYKEGICSHFATAAVLLYRALGIPARFTGGYSTAVRANDWVNIYASNAHAWAEVYVEGLGWVAVDVTPLAYLDFLPDGSDNQNLGTKLSIKPVDQYLLYTKGAVLKAQNELQGLSALLEKGYSYEATVEGERTTIGIGKSTITSFRLFDPSMADVTDQYDISFSSGKLQLFLVELVVSTESLEKIYDATALLGGVYSIDGQLILGHSISEFKQTGKQIGLGKSENSCTFKVVDQEGNDVSYMYKITKNYGTLEVTAREIVIIAESASKSFDGAELVALGFVLQSEHENALALANTIEVRTSGSQTQPGRSSNEIVFVAIKNENGLDVTGNYAITLVAGLLTITPPVA